MYEGKLVFAQLMDHLPMHTFRRCVTRFTCDHSVKSFTCRDQLTLPNRCHGRPGMPDQERRAPGRHHLLRTKVGKKGLAR